MKGLEIRKAIQKDVAELREISIRTFTETFGADNTEENMTRYLEEGFSTTKLKAELDDPDSEFYFALIDGHVAGYLKLNFGRSQTEEKGDESLEIERIYVLRVFHGKDIGHRLLEKAIGTAKRKKLGYVWLGVWEKNPRAIRFYEKNGFVAYDSHIFMLGDDKQTDILMRLEMEYE